MGELILKMLNRRTRFARVYTNRSLFQLFMLCVFPIHAWALLMGFRDFGWVAARTSVWDGLGLLSYSLTFALVESLGIFLILVILGFLIPHRLEADKRLTFLGTAFLVVAIWAIGGQVYSWMRYPLPTWYADLLIRTHHPFRYFWITVFSLAILSAGVPLLLLAKQNKFNTMMIEFFDRISTISSLYIFFDLVGIVIIVIRNLPG